MKHPRTKQNLLNLTDRRTFMKQAGVLASAAVLGITPSLPKSKYKMGLQLYTLRDPMAKDAKGTLSKIASIGYENMETYGYDAANNKYYGFPAKEFKQIIDAYHLITTSGHYDLNLFLNKPVDDLNRYVDQCIEGAHILKQEYITWPWLDPESRTIEKFKQVAGKLNLIGERLKKANLSLAYHNHDFEFIEQNGQIGYDVIVNETDPALVKLQLDIYWAMHSSKRTPREWFEKQPGRFVMWHLKDMDKTNRELHSEVGNGTIDFKSIMPDAALAGLQYFFVEQGNNLMADPFQSVANSADYIRTVLMTDE